MFCTICTIIVHKKGKKYCNLLIRVRISRISTNSTFFFFFISKMIFGREIPKKLKTNGKKLPLKYHSAKYNLFTGSIHLQNICINQKSHF